MIPAEEHAAKIASARDAIGDSDFFLVARTDARSTSVEHGLSEAISRANLYLEVIRIVKNSMWRIRNATSPMVLYVSYFVGFIVPRIVTMETNFCLPLSFRLTLRTIFFIRQTRTKFPQQVMAE